MTIASAEARNEPQTTLLASQTRQARQTRQTKLMMVIQTVGKREERRRVRRGGAEHSLPAFALVVPNEIRHFC